jgi:hypothetical protein
LKEVRRLTKKARNEVEALLRRERAGTITRKALFTGLEEVAQDLKSAWVFHFRL